LPCLPADLRQPAAELAAFGSCRSGDWMVARTGYTGEDGLEIMLPEADAPELWQRLLAAGVRPCGLGARDSLRLEAGLNLYGSDMDGQTDPLESGLGWTVAWNPEDRDFVGRSALAARSSPRRFVGLLLLDPGVLRAGAPLLRQDRQVGEVTSGGFAPTLGRSVGMGRILPGEGDLYAELRGRRLRVKLHKPPFVKRGKICIDLDAP
jgi:aminomethyltransferase